jgi:biopolymer transport protein ExbD
MKIKRRKLEIVPPYVMMADIAFNLVLFFLMLAKVQDNSNLQWEPVKAAGIKQVGNAKVSITVDKDNKLYLNGDELGMRDLAPRLEKELEGKAPNERIVLLKIHKDTLAATFEPIIEAVSQVGGEVMHVLEEEQPS